MQNLIWCLPFWRSKALKAFLDVCQLDAIFTVLNDSIPLNQIQKILEILDDQERLDALATSAYDCGRRFHDKSHMKKMLWDDIIQLYEGT